jgi:hypothetical protein
MLLISTFSVAQTLQEINEMLGKSQFKKAKDGIDKYLSDAKNAAKADGWYYKGRVYNSYSKDSSLAGTEIIKLKLLSFEAFKKYQQLDSKELSFVLENHVSYFDLYNGFFDLGAKEFNAKNYTNSFEGFKNALMVEEYIRSKNYEYGGFKFTELDTSLVQNIAMAANNAKDEASAVKYYRKLADADLAGDQYLSIYVFLVDAYSKNNDEANLNSILDKGRKLYPGNEYWYEWEIDKVSKTGNREALYAKYEELNKKYPSKYMFPYNLAVELFNDLYTRDKKPSNFEAFRNRLSETLKIAIKLDTGTDANMLMARHLHNTAYDYQDSAGKYKGTKPDVVKKRTDFKALSLKKVGEAITYAEASVAFYASQPALKPGQKANYKNALDMLAQLYAAKGDLKKSAEYEKKKAAFDK